MTVIMGSGSRSGIPGMTNTGGISLGGYVPGTGPGTGVGGIRGSGPGTTTIGPATGFTLPGWVNDVVDFGRDVYGNFRNPPGQLPDDLPGGLTAAQPCPPGFHTDLRGRCVADQTFGTSPGTSVIPGSPGIMTPAEQSLQPGFQAGGMVAPSRVAQERFACPKFADNKTGILWFSPMSNQVVCLPRGVNGKGFGLLRKNKPRAKAKVTAAQWKQLKGAASTAAKMKTIATEAGWKCSKR